MRSNAIGWIRRLGVSLVGVLALAVVAAVGPASQASAAPNHSKFCWTVWENGHLKVYCVDIQVQWPWDKYMDCIMCGLTIDWQHDPEVREEIEGIVGEQVAKGLTDLGLAAFTKDPALQQRLRTEALGAFDAAALAGGQNRLSPAAVGQGNPEKNTFEADPHPWSQAGAQDLADGMALLKQAAANPRDAAQLRRLATAQFDEAYTEFATQRAIG